MAEQEDRTESATQKKLDDAKNKGDVPRSSDFTAAWVVFGAAGVVMKMTPDWGGRLFNNLIASLSVPGDGQLLQPLDLFMDVLRDVHVALWIFMVMGVIVVSIAAAGTITVGGWVWSPEKAWDWKRISFSQGLKKPFTKKGVSVLWEDLVKTMVLGLAMLAVLWVQKNAWFQLLDETPRQAIPNGLATLGDDFLIFSSLLLLPGVVDMVLQKRFFVENQKMSKQEVRDEFKEMDGNPHVKNKLRMLRRKMARSRMMKAVETATVVVTNPEHFSVALWFEEDMPVPVVVAKGLDEVAFRIRDVAAKHAVPVLEAPAVARSLHKYCEIGDPIPPGLYEAIAVVLAYIDHLDRARAGEIPMPKRWLELKLGETLGVEFEQESAAKGAH